MESALFISDLHLDPARPHITALFFEFLKNRAAQAQALFILGDLFEAWIGDDDLWSEPGLSVAKALREVPTDVYFLHGNRDFLLGEAYAERAGITLIADPTVIELGNERVLLLHGDTLCSADRAYQRTRAQLRNPQWQATFLAESLDDRREFAERARAASRDYTGKADADVMDVTDAAVMRAFERAGVSRMIHGHTHRPFVHQIDGGYQRIVLGDWYEQGSVLSYSSEGFDLQTLALV